MHSPTSNCTDAQIDQDCPFKVKIVVTRIDTKSIELEIDERTVPMFINEVATNVQSEQEFYLTQDPSSLEMEEREILHLQEEQKVLV